MSDLYFSTASETETTGRRIEAALRASSTTSIRNFTLPQGKMTVARAGDADLWGPLHDRERGIVFAVAGRPVFDDLTARSDFATHETPQPTLTWRVYHDYLRAGLGTFDRLHGSFVILLFNATAGEVHVRTDRLGIIPLYRCQNPSSAFTLSTNPDLLAAIAGAEELDLLSLAEHVRCGRCVHPFTHFTAIRELDPGSDYRFDLSGQRYTATRFWRPTFQPEPNRQKVIEHLAQAITKAVRRRTDHSDQSIAVFLSGGADSRNILFGATRRNHLRAMTVCDSENREVSIARQLARRAGVDHQVLVRDVDFYPRNAPRAMRLSCGMWNFEDGHFVGIESQLRQLGVSKTLTGCYADFLFKGLVFNRRPLRIGHLKLPLYRAAPFSLAHSYLWQVPIAAHWAAGIKSRLELEVGDHDPSRHDDIALLELEARRSFPLSRAPSAAGRMSLWKLLPWETIFADNDILDAYQRIRPAHKINGDVFQSAVMLVCTEAADIVSANTGLALTASLASRLWHGARAGAEKRLRAPAASAGGVSTEGSWPNWSKVMDISPLMRQQWNGFTPAARELAGEILGYDPWTRPLTSAKATDVELYCRLYSLLLWFEHRTTI